MPSRWGRRCWPEGRISSAAASSTCKQARASSGATWGCVRGAGRLTPCPASRLPCDQPHPRPDPPDSLAAKLPSPCVSWRSNSHITAAVTLRGSDGPHGGPARAEAPLPTPGQGQGGAGKGAASAGGAVTGAPGGAVWRVPARSAPRAKAPEGGAAPRTDRNAPAEGPAADPSSAARPALG